MLKGESLLVVPGYVSLQSKQLLPMAYLREKKMRVVFWGGGGSIIEFRLSK